MAASAGIGNGSAALWYRVHAVSAGSLGGTAAADYAAILPAALNAARHRRPFIVGWLSRGGGAPLELITNAGPLSPAGRAAPAEDARPANQARPAKGARPADEARPAEDARRVEDARPADEARPAEDARRVEDARPAEETQPATDGAVSGAEPAGRAGSRAAAAVEMLFPWGARGTVI